MSRRWRELIETHLIAKKKKFVHIEKPRSITYKFLKSIADEQWRLACLVINRKCWEYYVGDDVAKQIKDRIRPHIYDRLQLAT
jgi:hypothetical protein